MMEVCDAPDSGDKHTAKEYQAFRALLPAQYPHAPQQCKAWNLICWYCFVTGFRIWGFLLLHLQVQAEAIGVLCGFLGAAIPGR